MTKTNFISYELGEKMKSESCLIGYSMGRERNLENFSRNSQVFCKSENKIRKILMFFNVKESILHCVSK